MSVTDDFPERLAPDALARHPANAVPNRPCWPAARPAWLNTVVAGGGLRRIYQLIGKTCGYTYRPANRVPLPPGRPAIGIANRDGSGAMEWHLLGAIDARRCSAAAIISGLAAIGPAPAVARCP